MSRNLPDADDDANNPVGRIERGIRHALGMRGARKNLGDAKAAEMIEEARRADLTIRKREQATAIGTARIEHGQGIDLIEELGARDAQGVLDFRQAELDAARIQEEQWQTQLAAERHGGASKRKQSVRAVRRIMKDNFLRRHMRDVERELAQVELLALEMMRKHGIRHHYRPLVKVAFFIAYMCGLDHNGALAFRTLHSINMPRARIAQVLDGAYNPQPHQPRRDVCKGKRAKEKRFMLPPGTELAQRDESHRAAIIVIQCAVFEWLAKVRTARPGYSYVLRGFGRGLFMAICQCGKDAISGHDDGTPGAMIALKNAGFHQYGTPPAPLCTPLDLGPTGNPYNVHWFLNSAEEQELDALHAELAQLGRLPLIERLRCHPDDLDAMLARGPPGNAWSSGAGVEVDAAEIPF